jgi:serine/threonine protein kinase
LHHPDTPIDLRPDDEDLACLRGCVFPSSAGVGVSYRIDRMIGAGSTAVAFFALRVAPDGESPVVWKVLRPDFMAQAGTDASKAVVKEAVALARLNERVPRTPFVVRLYDTGAIPVRWGRAPLELPWLALEHVHGGVTGTTLTDRIGSSLRASGYAFDPARAARAVECLCKGLDAVHQAGVIHRDVKPDNVLCCGLDEDEMFKISDLGVARASGVQLTFAGMVGTVGYAAPELFETGRQNVGPWSDVFGLAAVIHYLLAAQDYLPARSIAEALRRAHDAGRRSLLDAPLVDPGLKARPSACRAIDAILARATSVRTEDRPAGASALGAELVPLLRTDSWRDRHRTPRRDSQLRERAAGWEWTPRLRASPGRVVRGVGWDSDGTCLIATTQGLSFWDGATVRDAPVEGLPEPGAIRFVRRLGPGRWLVACQQSCFALYTMDGVSEIIRLAEDWFRIDIFSGDTTDLALAAGESEGRPLLMALSGRRWLKPLPIEGVARITSLARIEDTRWLVAGRTVEGRGYAGVCSPLEWEVEPIEAPPVRAMLTCGGDPALQIGVIGGTDGGLVWCEGGQTNVEDVGPRFDISAVAVDSCGTGWAAGARRILSRVRARDGCWWELAWEDPSAVAPITSLFADVGHVLAMAADGAVLEGRPIEIDLQDA